MYKLKKLEENENISYRRQLNIINISAVKKIKYFKNILLEFFFSNRYMDII